MKVILKTLTFLFLFSMPESSFAIVYMPKDSVQITETVKTKGDKIAQFGQTSSIIGTILFTFAIILVAAIEFEMRGGFLLLLLYGSYIIGPILALLGLALCITALVKKDTTTKGRKKARTGLFLLLFGTLLSTILILLFLG